MNCNLIVQASPEIKGEVTSPSWENREKFAASREKCFRTEDTGQKHGYIISSCEPLADLFFPILQYLINQSQNKNKLPKKKKKKKKKKKCSKKIFCKALSYFILILFLFFKGVLKNPKRIMFLSFNISPASKFCII